MTRHMSPLFKALVLGTFVMGAVLPAASQDTQEHKSSAEPQTTTTDAPAGGSAKKTKPEKKAAAGTVGEAKPKAGQYATESEARSHCRGTVVWVDQDHFNHYAGSREYGKKPGAFACEHG